MFCENCGAKMADNDMFCQNCGKKIAIPAAQSAPTQSVNQAEQNAPIQQTKPVEEASQPASASTAVLEHHTPTVAPKPAQNITQQNNVPQQTMPQMNPYPQQPQQNPYSMPNNQQFAPQPKKQSNFKITKKMVIIASSVAAVLIIGIVVLMICINNANNPVNKMIDAINNGDYSEAKSIYYNNMDSVNENQSVVDALQNKVDEVAEQYKNGTIDYDTAIGKLNSIDKVPLSSLTDIDDVRESINNLYYSKKNFEQAEEYLADKEYSSAIYYYDLVSEDDSNYSKAQEQKTKAIDGIRQNYLDRAKEDADNQNYAYAVGDLRDGLNNNEYLENDEKLTKQIDTYVDEVIKKSDEFMAAKNYDDAEDVVNDMMYAFESDTEQYTKLENQLTKIQTETPVYLQNIDLNSSDYFYRYQGGSKDVVGNSYDGNNVCTMSVSKYSPDSGAYAEMYVKDYKKVKGTLAVKQTSSSINDATAYIEILDNNKKVLYKSETFTNKSKAVTFEVNITDVEWLTIRLVNAKKTANGTISVILADVEFYKIGSSEPDAPVAKEETSKPETSKAETSKNETSKTESSAESSKAESSKSESSAESSKEESSKTESSKSTSSQKAESSKAA